MRSSGKFGELRTANRLSFGLNSDTYTTYRNLILPSQNGTTEIDHLVISKYGLFIVETKNQKGWIFGSEKNKNWTQVLYDKKYQFYNPLKQAHRQKMVLAEFLDISKNDIHTLVHFSGKCKFKTKMPPNVMKSGISTYIKRYRIEVFTSNDLREFQNELITNRPRISKAEHISSLKQRHSSKSVCPRCGGNLLLRTAKKGKNAGSKFYGCDNFPKCRFTKKM